MHDLAISQSDVHAPFSDALNERCTMGFEICCVDYFGLCCALVCRQTNQQLGKKCLYRSTSSISHTGSYVGHTLWAYRATVSYCGWLR